MKTSYEREICKIAGKISRLEDLSPSERSFLRSEPGEVAYIISAGAIDPRTVKSSDYKEDLGVNHYSIEFYSSSELKDRELI